MSVVGLDIGRSGVKVFTGDEFISFPAVLGEWRELKLGTTSLGKGSFEGEFRGEKFFAGVLAENESEFQRQMMVETKATPDALLLALIGLHQTNLKNLDVVTGVPIDLHDNENKQSLINLLQGEWVIVVNGEKKIVSIKRVRVAVEGGGAFWSKPRDGLVRLVDGGSKTINFITMKDREYVDRDSGTMPFGFDTNKSTDVVQMVTRIAGELGKKWSQDDLVFTVGGRSRDLAEHLRLYFPYTRPLHPQGTFIRNGIQVDLNKFANAMGYYEIGRTVQ